MKTIEEKAKAYDEIIERAKTMLSAGEVMYGKENNVSQLITDLIPELRESEDERIIEEIKFAVMQMPTERQDTKERCIAWLEKQKEQKPTWSEEDEAHRKSIISTIEMCMNECKRAEQRTLEAYPKEEAKIWTSAFGTFVFDQNAAERNGFQQGYEQAEKDLGWHSVDESLPPMGEEVIVLTNVINGRVVDPARYICFGHIVNKEYAVDYDGWNIPGVKYWMLCPKLPEE